MSCNCKKNGTTDVDFLTLVPGGTAANATYQLAVTHYLCGNRKVCANGNFPVMGELKYQVMGTPVSLGNGTFCCQVLCTGQVTYMPYKTGQNCGCDGCNCPKTDNVYFTLCVPCESATVPIITGGIVVATPTNLSDCCNITNAVELTTSINVATPQAATTNNG